MNQSRKQLPEKEIDYVELAQLIRSKPAYERKLLHAGVDIMADKRKRTITGTLLIIAVCLVGLAVAFEFRIPPVAFWALLSVGFIAGLVVVLHYFKIL